MRSLTEHDIRDSFVNCSKGEAKRVAVPRDLDERPWGDLDFLGWRDPGAPDRSYLVTERGGGRLVGLTLRLTSGNRGFLHRSMCSLCLTTHPGGGVSLMTARKAGAAGREGNSVGLYMCTDMACSLYVRGRKVPQSTLRMEESLTLEEQIARTTDNLSAFIDRVHS
ncbi:FBP domain-containing protein [Streptomyces sp. NPDC001652]|uniref:FBP domain-containing protein n=1 Tax=Streptomyces sp. NPDC001652 TaxID=3154393 RepID=UPI003319116B